MSDPRPEWVEAARRVLADNGANSERGWHSRFCFDRDGCAECDCTETVARLALAAVIDQIKAEAWDEAVDEALGCGWIHDWANDDLRARNPYRAAPGAVPQRRN